LASASGNSIWSQQLILTIKLLPPVTPNAIENIPDMLLLPPEPEPLPSKSPLTTQLEITNDSKSTKQFHVTAG
jgi:hypothetical protein